MGTGIELGGYDGRKDGALEDPGVLAKPEVVFAPTKPDVNASIEKERTGGQRNHRFFAGARPKTSSGPPSFLRLRRASRPVSTASRSSTTRRTASELLRDWRALRSRRIFPTSSKGRGRVLAAVVMWFPSV